MEIEYIIWKVKASLLQLWKGLVGHEHNGDHLDDGHGPCASWWPLWSRPLCQLVTFMVTAFVPLGDHYGHGPGDHLDDGHGPWGQWWWPWTTTTATTTTTITTTTTTTTSATTSAVNWNCNCNRAVDCIVWELDGETIALFATWSYWNNIFKGEKEGVGRLEVRRRAGWRSVWAWGRGGALRQGSRAVEEKEGRIVKIEELQHLLMCKIWQMNSKAG